MASYVVVFHSSIHPLPSHPKFRTLRRYRWISHHVHRAPHSILSITNFFNIRAYIHDRTSNTITTTTTTTHHTPVHSARILEIAHFGPSHRAPICRPVARPTNIARPPMLKLAISRTRPPPSGLRQPRCPGSRAPE